MFLAIFRKYSVMMTQDCITQIKAICKSEEFLRLLVEGGAGCGGFTYKFEISKEMQENDQVFEEGGAKLVVDKESCSVLKGAVVDYTQEMIRRAFIVKENPNAEMTCGCGSSFSPKAFK